MRHFPARHTHIKTHRLYSEPLSIAIIVRTKDRPHLLTRCLRSLAEQKRLPDEVIIINDGGESVDQIIQLFTNLDIQLIDNKTNLGRSHAGNQGVIAAQSDVIGFLDDDDRYLPDHLLRLEKALQHFDNKVVYSGCYLIQRDLLGDTVVLQEKPIGQFNDPYQAERLQYENYIPLINLLIDRELWLKSGGFDDSFNIFEDWDVLLRLSQHTAFYHVNRLTTEYAIWGNQQITRTTEKDRWLQAYRQILAKHHSPLTSDQLGYLANYWYLSQERRSIVTETRQEIQQLQSKLLETQHQLAQIEPYKQHYDNLQHHYQQLQSDKDRQHQEWEQHYARLESDWQQRIGQLRIEHEQQLSHHLSRLQAERQEESQTWQAELKKQHINWQITYYQKENQLLQQLQQINQLEQQYQQQQTESLQLKQTVQELQARLHECSQRISLGLNQATMERILRTQPPVYANLIHADHLRFSYQCLVDWCEEKRQQLININEQFSSEILNNLREEFKTLRTQLHHFTEKAVKSRWLHYGGYVKLLDKINETSSNLTHQFNNYVVPVTRLLSSHYDDVLPTPRQLSAFYPSILTFADNQAQLHIMQHTEQRGNIAFHLGMGDALVFSVYSPQAGFCRIDIAMATYIRINACHLRFIIRELGKDDILRVVNINAMIILDNLFHPISFEPLTDSAGKTYQIEIDSPDADEQNAVAIWCHQTPALPQTFLVKTDGSVFEQETRTLPTWLQNNITEIALPNCLFTKEKAEHLFLISGAQDVLSLHLFLNQLADALNTTTQQAQVMIVGELNASIQNYCQHHQLATLPQTDFVYLLNNLRDENLIQSVDYTWFCHVNALPTIELIQHSTTIFNEHTDAALLVPLQILPNDRIAAGYALIGSTGELHHFPVDMPAQHPYHGYRRTIQAASSHLIIIKNQYVSQINTVALTTYHTLCYQVTELIWQLQAQRLATFYESACAYSITQPIDNIVELEYEQDRKLFFQRWQMQLASQAALTGSFLLNPKQLPTILILDATLPTYDEDSGSLRIFTIMKLLMQLGYRITFFPDNLDSCFKYRHALESLGIEVFHGAYTIGDALSYRHFDFAMICRVDIGHRYIPFIRLMSPKTKIFYDTVDIHYIREFRQAEIENNPQLAENAKSTKRKELSNCLLADLTLTVTEDDGKHLQQELPNLPFAVLPNVHESFPISDMTFEQRDGLVFIGNYNHQPNEDAVFYFVEHVLPKIHAHLPEVKLYLIGSNMKERMKKLANEHIQVIGWVDKVEPEFAKRRIFVSYLRYGAGMKGKLGQALSLGLPIVTTQIGAEGMGLVEGETALIADEPEQFAQAVCRLYTDEVLWQKLAQQGRDFIEHRYGETAICTQLKQLFQ